MIVSLDALKAHLNISENHDDAVLDQKLAAAHAAVARFTGLDLDEEYTEEIAPADLVEGVLQYAAHLFAYREGQQFEQNAKAAAPLGVFDLLAPYKTWSF